MSGKYSLLISLFLLTIVFQGCRKPSGTLIFNILPTVDNCPLQLDTLAYSNAAHNRYMVNDVQFFISKISLINDKNEEFQITKTERVHYYDVKIPSTHTFSVSLPAGNYKYLKFEFGLDGEDNKTGLYPNPPENNMSWPSVLGGGYHYMKINGKWLDNLNIVQPFNLHLGKISDDDNSFIDNTFEVKLPLDKLSVLKNDHASVTIGFDINRWFCNPNIYDFNQFGGAIMQNREAQLLLRENGCDVFYILKIE